MAGRACRLAVVVVDRRAGPRGGYADLRKRLADLGALGPAIEQQRAELEELQ